MPIVASGFAELATALSTSPLFASDTPFHLFAGTVIACAIICCVPEVSLRRNISDSSIQGLTWPDWPNPQTKYAASALIDTWLEAAGTTISMTWFGPKKSPTSAGNRETIGQVVAKT